MDDLGTNKQEDSGIDNPIQNEQYPLTEQPGIKDGQSLLRRSTPTCRPVDRLMYA